MVENVPVTTMVGLIFVDGRAFLLCLTRAAITFLVIGGHSFRVLFQGVEPICATMPRLKVYYLPGRRIKGALFSTKTSGGIGEKAVHYVRATLRVILDGVFKQSFST